MTMTAASVGKEFCDWCGAPNEIVTKIVGSGYDPKTGLSNETQALFVRCTKLHGVGWVRNAFYDREGEGFGHTDDRVKA
jgi:hypothetical protein